MVWVGEWRARRLVLSIRPEGLTLSLGDPHAPLVLSYDAAGRLWSAYEAGAHYRRALNGRVMRKHTALVGARSRAWLTASEADALLARASDVVAALLEDWYRHGLPAALRDLPHAQPMIARAAQFTPSRAAADASAFARVYRPIGILPPDQYLAFVLQMTEGCSFNTCTFCSFYRDRVFRVKTVESFREHIAQARAFFGGGLAMRRSIFLGDANALVIPMARLLPLLQVIAQTCDVLRLGIYAFVDGFSGERKSAHDYRALAEMGVRRVYIGMESGNATLLRFLRKPGEPEDVLNAVRAMKAGGVAVGVIVLVGAGGESFADEHVRDTVALLNAMPLDARDIIYFSDLVVTDDLPYAQQAREANLRPLDDAALSAQRRAIVAGLRFRAPESPRLSRYDIQEFIY